MDKVLTQLVEKLQKAYGDRLVSVVLYGSAVAGDHHPHFSDYNVLCVLSEITSRQLAAGEDVFQWWRKQGSLREEHSCPLFPIVDRSRNHHGPGSNSQNDGSEPFVNPNPGINMLAISPTPRGEPLHRSQWIARFESRPDRSNDRRQTACRSPLA